MQRLNLCFSKLLSLLARQASVELLKARALITSNSLVTSNTTPDSASFSSHTSTLRYPR